MIPLRQIGIALSQWGKRREERKKEVQTPLRHTNPLPRGSFLPALRKALRQIATKGKAKKEKEEVWIVNHTYFAQEWAIAAHKNKKPKGDVPTEYQ